jgi:hypothetical protein
MRNRLSRLLDKVRRHSPHETAAAAQTAAAIRKRRRHEALSLPDGSMSMHADTASLPRRLPVWRSPEQHADQLLRWLRANSFTDGCLLSADMEHLHHAMCAELGWMPRAWSPIGRAIALKTTGGRKPTAYIDGRRLRVYPLPSSSENVVKFEEARPARGDSRVAVA